jgi:hypothetical protein
MLLSVSPPSKEEGGYFNLIYRNEVGGVNKNCENSGRAAEDNAALLPYNKWRPYRSLRLINKLALRKKRIRQEKNIPKQMPMTSRKMSVTEASRLGMKD